MSRKAHNFRLFLHQAGGCRRGFFAGPVGLGILLCMPWTLGLAAGEDQWPVLRVPQFDGVWLFVVVAIAVAVAGWLIIGSEALGADSQRTDKLRIPTWNRFSVALGLFLAVVLILVGGRFPGGVLIGAALAAAVWELNRRAGLPLRLSAREWLWMALLASCAVATAVAIGLLPLEPNMLLVQRLLPPLSSWLAGLVFAGVLIGILMRVGPGVPPGEAPSQGTGSRDPGARGG